MMKIKFTRNAERRLTQIKDYHADQGNPQKGIRTVKAIREDEERLKKHPKLDQEEESLKHYGKSHRYLLVEKIYKLTYRSMR